MSRTSPYFTKTRKGDGVDVPSSSHIPSIANLVHPHSNSPTLFATSSPSLDNSSSDIDIDTFMNPAHDGLLGDEIEEDELSGVVDIDVEKRRLEPQYTQPEYDAANTIYSNGNLVRVVKGKRRVTNNASASNATSFNFNTNNFYFNNGKTTNNTSVNNISNLLNGDQILMPFNPGELGIDSNAQMELEEDPIHGSTLSYFAPGSTNSQSASAQHVEEGWLNMYRQLLVFHKEHGHCKVMPKHNTGAVYQWCKDQGAAHKKGTLSPEKVALLKKIGFEWSGLTQGEKWDTWYDKYAMFKDANREVALRDILKNDPKLYQWIMRQLRKHKEGKLEPDKVARLDAVGFQWK